MRVGELELGRDGGRERASGDRGLRAEGDQAGSVVGDERHAETVGDDANVEASRRRRAPRPASGTQTSPLHAPSGLITHPVRAAELIAVDPQLVEDHRATLDPGGALRSPAVSDASGTRDPEPDREVYDAVVIGAGFAGMYMLHRMRGLGLSTRVYEAGDGRRRHVVLEPISRCALRRREHGVLVRFSDELQQEWKWTERYATQPEILEYANHVADRFDLRTRHPVRHTRHPRRHFDETTGRWMIDTDAR